MLTASIITAAGAALLYLASPRRKLLAGKPASLPLAASGMLLIVVSFALFRWSFGPATSVFLQMTLLMVFWTWVPLLLAYVSTDRGQTKGDATP